MSTPPAASIVIPTCGRARYLDVALASITPQARLLEVEVVVVNDGADAATAAVAARHAVKVVTLSDRRGVNGARNAGIRAARGDPIILVDDDVRVAPNWLQALLSGVHDGDEFEVFGGPIRAQLEGCRLRSCGREPPPISHYDRGDRDCEVEYVYGGNTAFRRTAFERVGYFDETLSGSGDEAEWVRRYSAGGGRIRYLAEAALVHRRSDADVRLITLTAAAYRRGREARRHDARVDHNRSVSADLRILAGCVWHTAFRRCAYGIVLGARAAGSLHEALLLSTRRKAARRA